MFIEKLNTYFIVKIIFNLDIKVWNENLGGIRFFRMFRFFKEIY